MSSTDKLQQSALSSPGVASSLYYSNHWNCPLKLHSLAMGLLLLFLLALVRPIDAAPAQTKMCSRKDEAPCSCTLLTPSTSASRSSIYQIPVKPMSDFPINILIYLEARGMLERLDSYHDVPYNFQAARFFPFRMEGSNGMVRIAPNSADASTDMRRALDHVDPLLFQFKDEMSEENNNNNDCYLTTTNVTIIYWNSTTTNATALQEMVLFDDFHLLLPIQMSMNVIMSDDTGKSVALDELHSHIASSSSTRFELGATRKDQDVNVVVSMTLGTSVHGPERTHVHVTL